MVDAAMLSVSVLCCRMSPDQKAEVVLLVNDSCTIPEDPACEFSSLTKVFLEHQEKEGRSSEKHFNTLAIGDGANDVKMIQSADIGVGIRGVEGSQAALSADFSFGQFRFLGRLLLHHGRLNYLRISRGIEFFFHKTALLAFSQFWFMVFSGFSGAVYFNNWYWTCFNTFFTSLPILNFGTHDEDVSPSTAARHPRIYQYGQENTPFRWVVILCWFLETMWQAAVIFFVPMSCNAFAPSASTLPNGRAMESWAVAMMSFVSAVLSANLRILVMARKINVVLASLSVLSMLILLIWQLFFDVLPIGLLSRLDSAGNYLVSYYLWTTSRFWLTILLTVTVALLPSFVWNFVRRWHFNPPEEWMVLAEQEKILRQQKSCCHRRLRRRHHRSTAMGNRAPALSCPSVGPVGRDFEMGVPSSSSAVPSSREPVLGGISGSASEGEEGVEGQWDDLEKIFGEQDNVCC